MNRNRYCEKSLVAFLVVRSKTLRTDGLDFDQECGKRGNGPRCKPTKICAAKSLLDLFIAQTCQKNLSSCAGIGWQARTNFHRNLDLSMPSTRSMNNTDVLSRTPRVAVATTP